MEESRNPEAQRPRRRRRRGGVGRAAPPPPTEDAGTENLPSAQDGPPPRGPEPPEGDGADEYADSSAFYRFSAFLGLAAVALLAAAIVTYNTAGRVTRNVAGLLIIAAILAVLYLLPRLGEIGTWLRTRTARQGGNVTLASVAFIGLLVVANWFVNRHSPQWDLTATGRYTLADQTVKIIDGLDRDVKITAFFPSVEDPYTRGTKDLLRQYDRRSDHISLEFIDPDLNPGEARQYEIQSYPITIFESGDRREDTTGFTEQDFTSALLKLTRTEQKKVYFLEGHQERDPDSAQPPGYNSASEALKRENYLVEKLSLLAAQQVPDDAAVLIIAGPRAPLLEAERQALDDYLNQGGHVLLLIDPRQDAGLDDLLSRWHVDLGDDLVIDPERNYLGDPLALLPVPQPGHRITASLSQLLMPGARSTSIGPDAGSDVAIAPLLLTTARAWGETNFEASARFDQGQDLQGPVTVAVSVLKTDPAPTFSPGATPTPTPTPAPGAEQAKGRLVVVGNSEFATNTYFNQVLGNRDFFINSVNWLAEDEDLISIRADPAVAPPIILSNQARVLVFYTSVVFVPFAILLLGGTVWWQRR
ncbi:MAG: GldG family protein [Chloroflexota bacterium]